ncbi:MAG TPA: hypothetical protein VKA48_10715 [Gammaproteobacteria bacterium]|nr:hypothetical protein [Gammaproteobacteria bacterium]
MSAETSALTTPLRAWGGGGTGPSTDELLACYGPQADMYDRQRRRNERMPAGIMKERLEACRANLGRDVLLTYRRRLRSPRDRPEYVPVRGTIIGVKRYLETIRYKIRCTDRLGYDDARGTPLEHTAHMETPVQETWVNRSRIATLLD